MLCHLKCILSRPRHQRKALFTHKRRLHHMTHFSVIHLLGPNKSIHVSCYLEYTGGGSLRNSIGHGGGSEPQHRPYMTVKC